MFAAGVAVHALVFAVLHIAFGLTGCAAVLWLWPFALVAALFGVARAAPSRRAVAVLAGAAAIAAVGMQALPFLGWVRATTTPDGVPLVRAALVALAILAVRPRGDAWWAIAGSVALGAVLQVRGAVGVMGSDAAMPYGDVLRPLLLAGLLPVQAAAAAAASMALLWRHLGRRVGLLALVALPVIVRYAHPRYVYVFAPGQPARPGLHLADLASRGGFIACLLIALAVSATYWSTRAAGWRR